MMPRDESQQGPTLILYGLKNGAIGAMELQTDEAIVLWEIQAGQGQSTAGVSLIKVAQLRENQPLSCIIVREDSSIEIYSLGARQGQVAGIAEPAMVFETRDSDTITGCVIGHITNGARSEILFTCYSGNIKSLMDKRMARKLGAAAEDTSKVTDAQVNKEKATKLTSLKAEVEALEKKAALEEEKF